jgi:hypothetical protein
MVLIPHASPYAASSERFIAAGHTIVIYAGWAVFRQDIPLMTDNAEARMLGFWSASAACARPPRAGGEGHCSMHACIGSRAQRRALCARVSGNYAHQRRGQPDANVPLAGGAHRLDERRHRRQRLGNQVLVRVAEAALQQVRPCAVQLGP